MQGSEGDYSYQSFPQCHSMYPSTIASPTRSIPIINPTARPSGLLTTASPMDVDFSHYYVPQWVVPAGPTSNNAPNTHFTPQTMCPPGGLTLQPDQAHPFGYSRLTLPHAQPGAQAPSIFNWSLPEPSASQVSLGRSKSLHQHSSPRFSYKDFYLTSRAAARPASSWPTTRPEHGLIDSLDMRNSTFPGSSPSSNGVASLPNSSPVSSFHSSNLFTSRDASPRSVPPSPLPSSVILPFIGAASDEQVMEFIHRSFPDGTPNYQGNRVALEAVLYSDWKRNNMQEPHRDHLLQFIIMNGPKWECLFYVGDERCPCSSTRKIQAVEHIRRHIRLEPYVCTGEPCPESDFGCFLRYSSPDPLRKHRKGKIHCELCARDVLPGNMRRHLENNCHEDT